MRGGLPDADTSPRGRPLETARDAALSREGGMNQIRGQGWANNVNSHCFAKYAEETKRASINAKSVCQIVPFRPPYPPRQCWPNMQNAIQTMCARTPGMGKLDSCLAKIVAFSH